MPILTDYAKDLLLLADYYNKQDDPYCKTEGKFCVFYDKDYDRFFIGREYLKFNSNLILIKGENDA